MKGLSTLSSVLFALFLAAACADDDDPSGGNTGGGSGFGGGANTQACQFPYAEETAATLRAATTSGACATDTDAVCGTNMVQVAGMCGVACNAQSTDLDTVAACTKECIQNEVSPKPSDGCTGCYVASVGCSIINCATECAAGPTSPCNDCRLAKGCTAAFYNCSGLPIPSAGTGGNGSGGSGNGQGGSAGAASGGAPNAGEPGSGGSR